MFVKPRAVAARAKTYTIPGSGDQISGVGMYADGLRQRPDGLGHLSAASLDLCEDVLP
jgi:hypothetical protein